MVVARMVIQVEHILAEISLKEPPIYTGRRATFSLARSLSPGFNFKDSAISSKQYL